MRILLFLFALVLCLPVARAAEPVKFSQSLHAKFHHARCIQCHQFNSRKNNGRAYNSHRSRYLCEQCHKPQLTGLAAGEWMAPSGEKMDYTGMNARDTCLLIKRNAPTGNTAEVLAHHLLHDARVGWALRSGVTPGGKREITPGGYAEWARDVNAWIEGGMSCD